MSKNANFSRISKCQWWQSVYISVILLQFLLQGYWYGLKTIQTDKNLDRYIDRLSADSRPIYRTAIFWLLTKCRPITDRYIGQVSTNYRPTIGEVSVNEKLYRPRHIWNDYRPCLDRVSTDYRPLYRPSVDWVLTECRPSIDRVSIAISTDIARSILPTVNKIRKAKNS